MQSVLPRFSPGDYEKCWTNILALRGHQWFFWRRRKGADMIPSDNQKVWEREQGEKEREIGDTALACSPTWEWRESRMSPWQPSESMEKQRATMIIIRLKEVTQIIKQSPKISGNHVIIAASSESTPWNKYSTSTHQKLLPNLQLI